MNRLHRLLVDNRGKGVFRVDNASADEATIYLYDVIGEDYFGGISAMAFAKELAGIKADTVHLRFNSPGGDVFAGQAMAQAIREFSGKTIAHIDGLAASAASWVALAADEVVISAGAFFMIHKAMTFSAGNSDELKATAELLDKVDATLIDGYVRETSNSAAQITDWMAAETWFNADDAVKYGFADQIAEDKVKASTKWILSAYVHAPVVTDADPAPTDPAPTDPVEDPPAPDNSTEKAALAASRAHAERVLAHLERIAA